LFSLAAKKYHELERGEGSDRRDSEIAVAAEGRARGERICRAAKSPGKLPTKEETVGDNVIEEVKPVGNSVLSIQVLSANCSPSKMPPHAEHPVEGSRVSMKPASVDAAVKELESATYRKRNVGHFGQGSQKHTSHLG
jgi:hypothetical protein